MSAKTAAEDAHYQARGVHIEWEDEQVGRLKGVGPVPRFSKTPQKIWRGTAGPGADNAKIYGELLGYSADALAKMKAKRVV
jgi:crotonobetainyl-CoA:carnitine CoA-transferase CaiB-like acyl-CoA transferase